MFRIIVPAICCMLVTVSAVHAGEKIRVNNTSGSDVCEFYISAHEENDWGDDLFEILDRCIHHGEYAEVIWPEQGNPNLLYDVRYVFRNGEEEVYENNRIFAGGVTVFNFSR